MIERAVEALERGEAVILPTDTVYGICSTAHRRDAVERLSRLKRRDEAQPIALVAAGVESLLEAVPELRGRAEAIARELLPGPYTLIFANPERRFGWLVGARPDTIGVRVPVLEGDAKAIVERVGAVAATSANLHGGPDPRSVDEIPQELLEGVAVVVDAGPMPGVASTVVDFTGDEPRVLREGGGDAARALEVAARA